MGNFLCTAIASVINLALLGIIPKSQNADIETLERRIRELESCLEKLCRAEA
jgi:translation elongation factor EF-1beta